jgi:hypothetical protein
VILPGSKKQWWCKTRKENEKGVDGGSQKPHNLVSVLLTNKTIYQRKVSF